MGQAKISHFRSLLIPSALIGFIAVCHSPNANADPASKVYVPSVVQGELELELNGGYQRWKSHDDDRERQLVVDVGYGFTSWWKSELAVGYTRLPGESYRLDELEWENIFALTEPGRYWADIGLFAELARDHANGRNVLAAGPMFQHEFGAIQSNLNFLLERGIELRVAGEMARQFALRARRAGLRQSGQNERFRARDRAQAWAGILRSAGARRAQ
ncbi:MAG: hypothetical protein E6H69_10180 [Betaproteobacteria bacterium]|nr:MAG: hypothetical protein E6H69_10180 [Betaproteobacteria bacterium]